MEVDRRRAGICFPVYCYDWRSSPPGNSDTEDDRRAGRGFGQAAMEPAVQDALRAEHHLAADFRRQAHLRRFESTHIRFAGEEVPGFLGPGEAVGIARFDHVHGRSGGSWSAYVRDGYA